MIKLQPLLWAVFLGGATALNAMASLYGDDASTQQPRSAEELRAEPERKGSLFIFYAPIRRAPNYGGSGGHSGRQRSGFQGGGFRGGK